MIRLGRAVLLAGALLLAAAPVAAAEPADNRQVICQAISDAALANGLPVGFLARLLWTESGFRSTATSPAGAQGVAQFMPDTAARRGLLDPHDPLEAIPQAGRLLMELSRRFGNLGLAAAAYNAGAARVAKWLQGLAALPIETRLYVQTITGRSPEDWAIMRGGLFAAASFPLPGLDCLNATTGVAHRGFGADPRERLWQTRLDNHLAAAVALFDAVSRSEAAPPPPPPMPVRQRHALDNLCDLIRSRGAACRVYGR